MIRQTFVGATLALLAVACLAGCSGGDAVKLGSVPVTAIAPSNPIDYHGGAKPPPNPKDIIKNIPGKPGKK